MRKILFILFLAPFFAKSQTIPIDLGYADTAHYIRISNQNTFTGNPQKGTLLYILSDNLPYNPALTIDSYRAGLLGSFVRGRAASGTVSIPAPALINQTLIGLGGDGRGTDSFHNVSVGSYLVKAEADFTNTSAPTYLSMMTTPTGSTTAVERMRIKSTGAINFSNLTEGIVQSSSSGDLSVLTGTASQVLRRNAANNGFEFATLTATVDTAHANAGAVATYANVEKIIKDSVFYLLTQPETIKAYQALGSVVKAQTLGVSRENLTTSQSLTDATARYAAVYVPQNITLTGFKFYQVTQGNYTADNYNGIAIYSYSSGTMTLVDSTTRDGNIWKGGANTWQAKALASPRSLNAGMYFIYFLYNSSAQTTAPAIGGPPAFSNAATVTMDFTNSAKVAGTIAAQTAPPNSQVISGLSNVANTVYVALY